MRYTKIKVLSCSECGNIDRVASVELIITHPITAGDLMCFQVI